MCVSIGWGKMISTSRIRSIYSNSMSMSLMPHHSISFLWMQRRRLRLASNLNLKLTRMMRTMKMIGWRPKREENENEYGNQKVIDRIGRMSAWTPIIL